MFFRKAVCQDDISVGQSFQRRRGDDALERAKVLGIASDAFGIPHVRYELTVEKPLSHQLYPAGTKVLSLIAFSEAYQEAIG